VEKILTLPGIAALGLWSFVHAEGGCPPGQYPQQGQGWQTCVPIPGAGTQQQATPPPPQWVSQWQAIATDKQKAVLGASMGKSSSVDSENAAISDCRAKGGVDCEIQISYRNGCVSMIIGDATMNTQGAATKGAADSAALAKCGGADTSCRVFYSACNAALRVQ
jgi:hypothetical protein